MQIIYRVQCRHGKGYYNARCCRKTYNFYVRGGDKRPTWERESTTLSWAERYGPPYVKDPSYLFAFPSLWALFQWFDPRELTILAREGIKVVKIQAREVIVSPSGRQCVWK